MDIYSEVISNTAMSSKFINTLYMGHSFSLFTLIVRPFFRVFLPRVTERRDHKSDHIQFHTESQNESQSYDIRTISSCHMQGCRKTVMQNLQDCRKTKRYVVRFPHCSRAVIVRFSVVVVRFAAFLRQPCDKAHGHLAIVLRLAKNYVSHTNTLHVLQHSRGSLACLAAVLRLSENAHKSQRKWTCRKFRF